MEFLHLVIGLLDFQAGLLLLHVYRKVADLVDFRFGMVIARQFEVAVSFGDPDESFSFLFLKCAAD